MIQKEYPISWIYIFGNIGYLWGKTGIILVYLVLDINFLKIYHVNPSFLLTIILELLYSLNRGNQQNCHTTIETHSHRAVLLTPPQ